MLRSLRACVPGVYRLGTSVVATAAGMVFCSPAAYAQIVTGTIPPPRPILTNPVNPPLPALLTSRAHRLQVSVSAFEAYDRNNLPVATQTTSDDSSDDSTNAPVYRRSGSRAGGNASLNYSYARQDSQRASMGANGRVSMNSFARTGRPLYTGSGGAYFGMPVGPTSNFRVSGTTRYSPFYNFGFFPGLGGLVDQNDLAASIDPNLGLAVTPIRSFHHTMVSTFSRQLSLRTSMAVDYSLGYNDFLNGPNDFLDQFAGASVSHRLTRDLSMRLGYRFGRISNGLGSSHKLNTIDAGVNYGKALSISRRTTVSFGTGSTILTTPTTGTGRVIGKHLHLDGRADLNHQMGQTWSAQLSYRRDVGFAQGFAGLFFNDSVSAGVGGSLMPRLTLGATGSYLSGSIASTTVSRHDAYHGNGALNFTLTSWASCYGHYSYYRFRLGEGTLRPVGFPDRLERHSVRAGVSLGFRLIG